MKEILQSCKNCEGGHVREAKGGKRGICSFGLKSTGQS